MRLKELTCDNVDVLALEGEIDFHSSPGLRSVLQAKTATGCPALILDFSAVRYIDSSGLAVIMEYIRDSAAREGILCLAGLNDDLKTIFSTVRLDKVIPIFECAGDAASAVNSKSVQPPIGIFNRPEPGIRNDR